MKGAEIFRFPRIKNHIEEFMAHDLPEVLEELKSIGFITGFCYPARTTNEFRKGIDFYIFVEGKKIPIQLTDNIELISIFLNEGIMSVFLPEKDKNGELLYDNVRRKIVIDKLEKISKQVAYI